ncbi:hypothetical protein WICMUC_003092 [Wickerhamomyces mucosus]|uniref:Cytochrome b5 heme-binding domain-containing protein n=1 Tax=Wickerhamomyces mucosus TaxID=1378264 RepID=A0A9P8TDU1_9ASCO|nr:hypothetical protein WICMUC_003092 [Wickerhamomyces mucosus]
MTEVKRKFAPKIAVELNSPDFKTKFTKEQLVQYNGRSKPQRYIAIKSHVFDVTKNESAYGEGTKYNVFCGYDASRALGKSSLNLDDVLNESLNDLTEKQLQTLDDWYSFFEQRYNIVGVLI